MSFVLQNNPFTPCGVKIHTIEKKRVFHNKSEHKKRVPLVKKINDRWSRVTMPFQYQTADDRSLKLRREWCSTFVFLFRPAPGDDCGDREHRRTCTKAKDCVYLEDSIRTDNYLDICSYAGVEPIVCCPEDAPDWYAAEPPARPAQQPIREPAVGRPTERPRPVAENRSKIAAESA